MIEYIDREAANLALAEQGFDWDKEESHSSIGGVKKAESVVGFLRV